VTSHHNCFSGIQLAFVSDSVIEENVSVRNAIGSGAFGCGGTCILQSDNNRIRRNEYSGNGSLASGNNDFGIGILGGSDGNVIEENSVGGNTNGIRISATAGSGNVVRRNIVAGNPPVQLGATGGVDIRDNSLAVGPASSRATTIVSGGIYTVVTARLPRATTISVSASWPAVIAT